MAERKPLVLGDDGLIHELDDVNDSLTVGIPEQILIRGTFTNTTSGDTTFDLGEPLNAGLTFVYYQGLQIAQIEDFNVVGQTVVLTVPVTNNGDVVDVFSFKGFTVADTYTQGQINTFLAAKQDSLPSNINAGYILSDDGAGNLSWVPPSSVSSWGSITGTLSNQTDLQTALDAKVNTSLLGALSGVATLDGTGKIPTTQMPSLTITDTFTAASEAAMISLSAAEKGDICIRTDLSKTFILAGTNYAVLGDWVELPQPATGSAVTSVDGRTGIVTLSDLYDNYSSWSFTVDAGIAEVINSGETIDFVSGTNITISNTGNAITFNLDAHTHAIGDLPANLAVTDSDNTFTANQTIAPAAGSALLTAQAINSTTLAGLIANTNGLNRWFIGKNNTLEAGTDSGSDLVITRYADAGTAIGDVLTISRSTGNVTLSGNISAANINNTNWDTAYNRSLTSAAFATGTGIISLTQQDTGTITVDIDGRYEPLLGNPGADGYVLSSTLAGVRSWIDLSALNANQNAWSSFAVATQTTVAADSIQDELTFVAGTNVTLTTDNVAKSITINASVPAQNLFSTIAVSGQTNVVADASTDTLTLVGSGITITTDAATDTVTFTNDVSIPANLAYTNVDNTFSSVQTFGNGSQTGVKFQAHGMEAGNTTRNEIRVNWTATFDRFYLVPVDNGAAPTYTREFYYDFPTGEWTLEGDPTIGGILSSNIYHTGNFISGTDYQAPLSNVAFTNVDNGFSTVQSIITADAAVTLDLIRNSPSADQVGMKLTATGTRYFGKGTDDEPYWATSSNISIGSMIYHEGNFIAGTDYEPANPTLDDVASNGATTTAKITVDGLTITSNLQATETDIQLTDNANIATTASMYFFIDSDNNSTTDRFYWKTNAAFGTGTDLMYLDETGRLFTEGDIYVGNATNKRLKTRHIDGKATNSTADDHLYLNQSNGNNVYINGSLAYHAGNFVAGTDYEAVDANLTRDNVAEVITADWAFNSNAVKAMPVFNENAGEKFSLSDNYTYLDGVVNSPSCENRMQFYLPTTAEYSTDGGSIWNPTGWTTTQLQKLMMGRYDGSSLTIDRTWTNIRLTWDYAVTANPNGYTFLNFLHIYASMQGNTCAVKTERRWFDTGVWSDIAPQTSSVGGWPTHISIPHANVSFTNSSGRYDAVRIELIPTWSHATNAMTLYNINWYGNYPASTHDNITYWNELGNYYITNELVIDEGTVTNPGLNFKGDTDTGLYWVSSGTLGISSNGASALQVDGAGVNITGDLTVGGGQVITNNTGARVKFSAWTGTTYGIGMQDGYTFGGLANNFALTFQMSDDAGRGFWWGDSAHTNAQGAMALTTDGKLAVAHSVRIGYGESNTTVPGATYRLQVSGSFNATSTIVGGGDITAAGNIRADNYFVGVGGQQLILAAGESAAQLNGVTGGNPLTNENVYAVAESGLTVISSPGNWINGANSYDDVTWALRHQATICDSSGNSSFPGNVTASGALTVNDIATSSSVIYSGTGDGQLTMGVSSNVSYITGENKTAAGGSLVLRTDNASGAATTALTIDSNQSAIFAANLYIPNVIYHAGDTDTYIQFSAADTWRVVTGGVERFKVTANVDTRNAAITYMGDDVRIGNYIYHDGDTNTYMQFDAVDSWRVVTNGVERIQCNGNGIEVPDYIRHTGDTDTYIQFHAADSWRVVTSAAERFEVTSTAITSQVNHDFAAGIDVTGNITVSGTVDGVDLQEALVSRGISQIVAATNWDTISQAGMYGVISATAFTGTGNPETALGYNPYRYGVMTQFEVEGQGQAQVYFPHNDTYDRIVYRNGWNNGGGWQPWQILLNETYADTLYLGISATAANATNATNATNFNCAADNTTNATHYPVFVGGATGNQRPNTDTAFFYNPSSNQLTVGTINATSDVRLKDDKGIYKSLDPLLIPTQLFDFKDKNLGVDVVGYYAQDVENVLPQAVSENDDGIKSVNYNIVHSAKIAALEEKINRQQLQITNMMLLLQQLMEK